MPFVKKDSTGVNNRVPLVECKAIKQVIVQNKLSLYVKEVVEAGCSNFDAQ